MKLNNALIGLLGSAQVSTAQCFTNSTTLTPLLFPWPSEVQFTSCSTGADSARLSPLNATTYDWWYFDAVSTDGGQGIVLIFFTSSALGFTFDFTAAIDPLSVYGFATFEDGTSELLPLQASLVNIETVGDGAIGDWVGADASFTGTADLSKYTLTLSNPLLSGTMTLTTVSIQIPRLDAN